MAKSIQTIKTDLSTQKPYPGTTRAESRKIRKSIKEHIKADGA